MSVYLVTGKLGAGKSLSIVDRAVEYAEQGRRIVTNYHLDLSSLANHSNHPLADTTIEVIEPRPSAETLNGLGRGGATEHEAGMLVLDECGTFLNARGWNGKGRQEIIDWFLHSRKLGWDVFLIVQHLSMLDKQIRDAVCEYLVSVARTDKMTIPLTSIKLPRLHIATVRYGLSTNDAISDRWVFRGNNYFQCYDTSWISTTDEMGHYSTIPARGRLGPVKSRKALKAMKVMAALVIGLASGYFIGSPSAADVSVGDIAAVEKKSSTALADLAKKPSEPKKLHPLEGEEFYATGFVKYGSTESIMIKIGEKTYNRAKLEELGYRVKAKNINDIRVIYGSIDVPVKS